jgi:hypothetical protein
MSLDSQLVAFRQAERSSFSSDNPKSIFVVNAAARLGRLALTYLSL